MAHQIETGEAIGAPYPLQRTIVDFGFAIRRAYQHAPILSPDNAAAEIAQDVDDWAGSFAHLADEQERHIPDSRQPNDVTTRVDVHYPHLLRQTGAFLWPHAGVPEDRVEEWAAHEGQHGEACLTVNGLASVFYGVRINRIQGPGNQLIPSIVPFFSMEGSLRKIDVAYIAVAPSRLSPADLRMMQALGYESPDEVRQRHAALS